MNDKPRIKFDEQDVKLLTELANKEAKSLVASIEMNKVNPHFDSAAASYRVLRLGMLVGKVIRSAKEDDASDS
jgi:hypothetical protein